MIYCFQDIPSKIGSGGKADILARLFRAGYPVPDGFVILPSAFIGDELSPAAWKQVREAFGHLKESNDTSLAVRSSALHEDSRSTSFAGQYETGLHPI
jgi:phosphoenolpyruvate synthase/pyruvate phosphate dikinase